MTEKEKATRIIYQAAMDAYPNNLLYVMPDKFGRKLKSFMLIREDLHFILEVIEKLISLKKSHESNNLTEFALWQSIIITYGKCFTENKVGMSKLDKSVFQMESSDYQQLHDNVMNVRNSYIAHRGDTANEHAIVFIKLSKTGYMLDADTEDIIIARKLASPKMSDLKLLAGMIKWLSKVVGDKIQNSGDKAHNAFLKNFTPEQAKAFLVHNMKLDEQ